MERYFYENNMERTQNQGVYNFEDSYPVSKCKVSLKNKELWKKFHELETEMIITKSGRRMFPSFHIQLSDLDPQAHYCILMEMAPASHCRFKYSSAAGWAPAGTEEAQSPQRIYVHPESPAKGEYWMSQPISFGRVKLTNTPAPPAGQVVLSSMHKYQPRIIIAKTSDPRTIAWSPSTCAVFPETQFIAVTAYQNEKITQLKIDNNPFAKGFRENGQAKCKRKRVTSLGDLHHEEDGLPLTDLNLSTESNVANNISNPLTSVGNETVPISISTPSRSRNSSESEHVVSICSSPLSFHSPTKKSDIPILKSSPQLSPTSSSYPYSSYSAYPNYSHPYPYINVASFASSPSPYSGGCYSFFPSFYSMSMWGMDSPYFYYPQGVSPEVVKVEDLSGYNVEKRPRKLTDFSIKAIIGC